MPCFFSLAKVSVRPRVGEAVRVAIVVNLLKEIEDFWEEDRVRKLVSGFLRWTKQTVDFREIDIEADSFGCV